MILDLVIDGNDPEGFLRKPVTAVTVFDENLKKTVKDMMETMDSSNGIGLSGPQVKLSKMIIVMNIPNGFKGEIINPNIIYRDKFKAKNYEGCLSIPGISKEVARPVSVVVQYVDANQVSHVTTFTGLNCICFLHEYDHLLNKLMTDYK